MHRMRILATTLAISLSLQPLLALPARAATVPPEVSAVRDGLQEFADFTKGLAEAGKLADALPFVNLSPGSDAALKFADLFQRSVVDRVDAAIAAASSFEFEDLEDIATPEGGASIGDGRTLTLSAEAATAGTVRTLALNLSVARVVDAPLSISNQSPKVSIASASGVRVQLQLSAALTFAFDSATDFFYLVKDDAGPDLGVSVGASIPDPAGINAAAGLLAVEVTGSDLQLAVNLVGSVSDPNGDGKLAFSEPSATGQVPGELATAANAAALVSVGFAPSPPSTLSGGLTVTTKPSTIPGLSLPPVTATVNVQDADLSDDTPPQVSATGFEDTLEKFQNVSAKDLAEAVAQLAVAITAIQSARFGDTGDIDLPFMNGRLSDAIRVNEGLRAFLEQHVHPLDHPDEALRGQPKFASVQEFFERIVAPGLLPDGSMRIENPAFSSQTDKFAFDLVLSRVAPQQDLNPAVPAGEDDPRIGLVQLGDALKGQTGLADGNGATAVARVTPSYDARITLVVDLRPPRTGSECSPQACPFEQTAPDGTKRVVTEQPLPADRFLLRTGRPLLTADAPITTAVDAAATVGFLKVNLAGNLAVTKPASGHMLEIALKQAGDAQHDVPLAQVFSTLAGSAGSLLDVSVRGAASASLTLNVPGAPDFFGGTAPSLSISMSNIADPGTIQVSAPDLSSLKDFDFDPSNPRALLGKIVDTLRTLGTSLEDLPQVAGSGSALSDAMGTEIPVLGMSFSELIDAEGIDQALAFVTESPSDSLQDLVDALNARLGGGSTVSFAIDRGSDPARLVLDVDYRRSLNGRKVPLGFSFDLGGTGRSIVGAGAEGELELNGSAQGVLKLSVPLDPSPGGLSPDDIKVLPSSNVTVEASATLPGGSLRANLGPITLALGKPGGAPEERARARAKFRVSITDTTHADADGPVSLTDWARNVSVRLNDYPSTDVSCPSGVSGTDLSLCAVFPAFVSTDGGATFTKLQEDPAKNNDFVLRLPRDASDAFSLDGTLSDGTTPRLQVPDELADKILEKAMDFLQFRLGVGQFLDLVAEGLELASLDGRLPLVGDDLQQGKAFLTQLRTKVDEVMATIPDAPTAGQLKQILKDNLETALGDAKLLKGTVDVSVKCRDPLDPSGPLVECAPSASAVDIQGVEVAFDAGQGGAITDDKGCVDGGTEATKCIELVDKPLDIGIPGLRLSAVEGPGDKLSGKLGWNLHVAFGMDKQRGFFLKTDDASGPELKVGLGLNLPGQMQADLAFLRVGLRAAPSGPPPGFTGVFSVDVRAATGAADPSVLTMKDLLNAPSVPDLFVPRISARALVEWDFEVSASDEAFPGLQGRFELEWSWSNESPGATLPRIEFKDLKLDPGKFFKELLAPVAQQIKTFVEPFLPIIDTLYAPLPVLSDLSRLSGGGDVSLVNLVKQFSTLAGGPNLQLIDRVLETVRLVHRFATAGTGGLIDLGGFTVLSDRALQENPTPDQAQGMIGGPAGGMSMAMSGGSMKDQMTPGDQAVLNDAESKAGFSFPVVENPSSVFTLIMGGDIDLVKYDAGTLEAGFSYRQVFGPVYAPPPVMITFSGAASVSARFVVGLDTFGLRKAYEAKKVDLSIFDGFFIDDFDGDGKEVPEVVFRGELAAGAQVTAVVISVSVDGGVRLTVNLDLRDPNTDGKVRASEFAAGLVNPFCLFDVSGNLKLFLRFVVTIGIGPFSKDFPFDLADITLLDFSKSCPNTEPNLGHVEGSTLIVHVGRFGTEAIRGTGWGNDTGPLKDKDEKVTVRALHDEATGTFRGFAVDLLGRQREFLKTTFASLDRVLVDGRDYAGALTVVMAGDGEKTTDTGNPAPPRAFRQPAIVFGGANNDVIRAGDGVARIDGGSGNDTIVTGAAADHVAGGPGGDTITTLAGGDRIAGDAALSFTEASDGDVDLSRSISLASDPADASGDGSDTIDAGLGADAVFGGGADDRINGGNNDARAEVEPTNAAFVDGGDVLAGGGGGDGINGGHGNDQVFGDWRANAPCPTGTEGALGEDDAGCAGGGADVIDTGPGTDTVRAGRGNDTVIGRSVADQTVDRVFGNGGNDDIAGGSGHDFLFGGPNNDVVRGLAGDDQLKGSTGNDDLIGGPGGDRIFGGPNDDHVLGDAGTIGAARGSDAFGPVKAVSEAPNPATDGIDRINGDAGRDTIFGGGANDVIFGDEGAIECRQAPAAPEWTPPSEAGARDSDGRDRVNGGPGEDRIIGDGRDDDVDGGLGDDQVCGSAGDDVVRGGPGADRGWGGTGADRMFGDDDADRLFGNDDADRLFGGAAGDHLEGNGAGDHVFGEADGDHLIGGSSTAATADAGDPLLAGGAGDDTAVGDNGTIAPDGTTHVFDLAGGPPHGGSDVIAGGAGADTGFGGLAGDTIFGEDGPDHLEGNSGADTVDGARDQDDILGGTSPLALAGGPTSGAPDEGDTLLAGGPDADVALGDNGEITATGDIDPNGPAHVRTVVLRDILTIGGGDVIRGDGGNDQLWGQKGSDDIGGGDGDDVIEGNNDADVISGGNDQDDILGGTSPRGLAGAPTSTVPDVGDTSLDGDAGADTILGDNGHAVRPVDDDGLWRVSQGDNSTIRTVVLLDRETVGGGDRMSGGDGNDRMWGEIGADIMSGGADDDYLEGNLGADVISGNPGSDDMVGGTSPVALPEADPAAAAAASADEGDRMFGDAQDATTNAADDDALIGDNGGIDRCPPVDGASGGRDDCTWQVEVLGSDPSGVAYGDPGIRHVTLLGESSSSTNHDGDDRMQGNSDNDWLWGLNGDDHMEGNDDVDRMLGGYGHDLMYGNAGVDAVLGDRAVITTVPLKGTPPQRTIRTAGPPFIEETIHVPGTLWFQVFLLDQHVGGDDRAFGGQGEDAVHGGAGTDYLQGDDGPHRAGDPPATGGNDRVFGGDGLDSVQGGPGRDHLFGGFGEDDLDLIRGADTAPKVPQPPVYATLDEYAADFPGTYDRDPGADGVDIVYGGHDRDIMQADALDDRLVDDFGAYNLFHVCPAAYGGRQIIRALSPGVLEFFQDLAEADGAIGAKARTDVITTTGAREASLIYPGQHQGNTGRAYPTTPGHFTCPPA